MLHTSLLQSGVAWCMVRNTDVSYVAATLSDHLKSKKHIDVCVSLEKYQRLPGGFLKMLLVEVLFIGTGKWMYSSM